MVPTSSSFGSIGAQTLMAIFSTLVVNAGMFVTQGKFNCLPLGSVCLYSITFTFKS